MFIACRISIGFCYSLVLICQEKEGVLGVGMMGVLGDFFLFFFICECILKHYYFLIQDSVSYAVLLGQGLMDMNNESMDIQFL